jgi:hypothetical protein
MPTIMIFRRQKHSRGAWRQNDFYIIFNKGAIIRTCTHVREHVRER